jgi:hypothetical protein
VATVAVVVAVAVAAAVAADAAAMVAAVTVAADVSAMAEEHPAGATATVSSAPLLLQLGPISGYVQHHSTHQRRFPRRVSLRHFGNLPPTHAKSGRLGGAKSHPTPPKKEIPVERSTRSKVLRIYLTHGLGWAPAPRPDFCCNDFREHPTPPKEDSPLRRAPY